MSDEQVQVQGQIQVGSVFEWQGASQLRSLTPNTHYEVIGTSKCQVFFMNDTGDVDFLFLDGSRIKWISHPTPTEPSPEQVEIDDGGPAYPVSDSTGIHPSMCLRQYAAIELRVPMSNIKWLDEMIREASHRDIAGQMAAAFMGAISSSEEAHRHIATHANKEGLSISEYMADLSHESAAKVVKFMGEKWCPGYEGGAE